MPEPLISIEGLEDLVAHSKASYLCALAATKPASAATFDHLPSVLGGFTLAQMRRVIAGRIVTRVMYLQFRVKEAISKLECNAMGRRMPVVMGLKRAVAVIVGAGQPRPTLIRPTSIDLRPESLFESAKAREAAFPGTELSGATSYGRWGGAELFAASGARGGNRGALTSDSASLGAVTAVSRREDVGLCRKDKAAILTGTGQMLLEVTLNNAVTRAKKNAGLLGGKDLGAMGAGLRDRLVGHWNSPSFATLPDARTSRELFYSSNFSRYDTSLVAS